jgi:hypothetical protein
MAGREEDAGKTECLPRGDRSKKCAVKFSERSWRIGTTDTGQYVTAGEFAIGSGEGIDVSIDTKMGWGSSPASKDSANVKVEAFARIGIPAAFTHLFSYQSSIWRSLIGG